MSYHRPQHLLCQGFQRVGAPHLHNQECAEPCNVPGVVSEHPNENVKALKTAPWIDVLPLLGNDGNAIIGTLLLDCGLFMHLDSGKDNLYQLSGIPLSDLGVSNSTLSNSVREDDLRPSRSGAPTDEKHKAGEIIFVRNRMLYAKPTLNAKGEVRFGMKHIHVFNRYPDHNNKHHVVHNVKYVFPRQFGLHNVFTSKVDSKETIQPFKDYTLREHEIARSMPSNAATTARDRSKGRLPKRLRGPTQSLVRKLLRNHHQCTYTQLLRHYCSATRLGSSTTILSNNLPSQRSLVSSTGLVTQVSIGKSTDSMSPTDAYAISDGKQQPSAVGYATPTANVSAFCQSVIRKLLPRDTFGVGVPGAENERNILASIDRFIRMRRFESLSLHEVAQGLSLTCIPWLRPPKVAESANMSQSDRKKRLELLLEVVYYIFDSLLIPLIRSNFYVTESNTHRNQLFYFRHDLWRKISEPSLTLLKIKMFEEMRPVTARKLLGSRSLGFSYIRLLPKAIGFRPIINLRRRVMSPVAGRTTLGKSINNQLSPVFDILNYERFQQHSKLGSALFSVGDIHARLRTFRNGLKSSEKQELFFVKVDVQTCFDTIPQSQLLKLIKALITNDRYKIGKHAEIRLPDDRWITSARKPARRFVSAAGQAGHMGNLSPAIADVLAQCKKRTIYTNTGNLENWDSRRLTKLLQEHVRENIIKIGKRHFRQKNGIPQGSVLSTLLCSFFYGDFENRHLDFLQQGESLLLRLIDDFLLVTTNQNHARRFLQVMADGSREYGITVNTSKSLANFEISVDRSKIPRHHGSNGFPYCGMLIDVRTLEVSKDRFRKEPRLSNTLTVEHNRKPGQTFKRKVLTSMKIQMQAILLDTSLNTAARVARSLFQNFAETAMKMHRYLVSLPRAKRPSGSLVIDAIKELTKLATNMTSGTRRTKTLQYTCSITATQMLWLMAMAFEGVLMRKQTIYLDVLQWLRRLKGSCDSSVKLDNKAKSLIVEESWKAFKDYKY